MDLNTLYQEIIVDHNKHPRNFYEMQPPCESADGFNPLCGDKLTLYISINNDIVEKASFVGKGCAISTASASLMTEAIQGKSIQDAQQLFNRFHDMVTAKEALPMDSFDKLTALAGVRTFPARVKCATLAWHTLMAVVNRSSEHVVSTE